MQEDPYLVALILGSEGVPKAQPGWSKGGVDGCGLAKVLASAVIPAYGLVVASHRKPGNHMLRIILHQPGRLDKPVLLNAVRMKEVPAPPSASVHTILRCQEQIAW